jgi:hypothetical protein
MPRRSSYFTGIALEYNNPKHRVIRKYFYELWGGFLGLKGGVGGREVHSNIFANAD